MMTKGKRTAQWAMVVAATLVVAGVSRAEDYSATVVVEASEAFRLAEAETVNGDLVVMGGKAHVLGRVTGNVLVVDGRATLGATARVDGDALTVRGEIVRHDLATVAGEARKLSAAEFAQVMARGAGAAAGGDEDDEDSAEGEGAGGSDATGDQDEDGEAADGGDEDAEESAGAEGAAGDDEAEGAGGSDATGDQDEDGEAAEVGGKSVAMEQRTGDVTNYGQPIEIAEDEVRIGSVASFGGPIKIEGEVRGDVVSLGGPIRIYGSVSGSVASFGGPIYVYGNQQGDIASFGGNVFLEEGSHVTGNIASFGGTIERADGAVLDGEATDFGQGMWGWLTSGDGLKISAGDSQARREKALPWVAGNITALVLTLLITLIFPNATRTVADVITEKPASAAAHGAVALLLVIPVCVLLAITCVGLLGVPLLLALVGALDLLGIVAVNLVVGRKTAKVLNWSVGSVLGLAIIGTLVLRLVAAARIAPFIGLVAGVVGIAVVVLGVGGALMTRFGTDPTGTYISRRAHLNGTAAAK